MDEYKIFSALMLHQRAPLAQHLRPCFIAPTGAGKTTRVQQFATEMKLPITRLLLGTMLPEDILGLPKVVNGVTHWAIPKWAHELTAAPGILFFDEIDKARPDCIAAVLTLLAEKNIRDQILHPDTMICAAGQPQPNDVWLGDETGQALSARLLFMPLTYQWSYLTNRLGINLDAMPAPKATKPILLPNPSPRQVEWFVHFARANPELARDVSSLLFDGPVAEVLLEGVQGESSVIRREDVASLLANDPDAKVLDKLTIPELVVLGTDIWRNCKPEIIGRVLERVWIDGAEEDAEAFLKELDAGFTAALAAEKEIDVGRGCTNEEMYEALRQSFQSIGQAWIARAEAEKGKAAKPKKGK